MHLPRRAGGIFGRYAGSAEDRLATLVRDHDAVLSDPVRHLLLRWLSRGAFVPVESQPARSEHGGGPRAGATDHSAQGAVQLAVRIDAGEQSGHTARSRRDPETAKRSR